MMNRKEKNSVGLRERLTFIKEMRLVDVHAHLLCLSGEAQALDDEARRTLAKQELQLRREHGIATCFSCGTPAEWEFLQRFADRREILTSFGIHPWYADQYETSDCRELFAACDLIGEIGMDSVWCEVSQKVQQRRLCEQLELAAELGKPVLLHTKGREAEIARLLQGFPHPVCVHWYSGSCEDLEPYLALGCYFTLGPDLGDTPVYRKMLREIPAERLFLETDGISAVAWAKGLEVLPIEEIPGVLEGNLAYLAAQKKKSSREMKQLLFENLTRFLMQ